MRGPQSALGRSQEATMIGDKPNFNERPEVDNPLGMSKYSIRRYSVQHFLLLLSLLALIIALNVQAVMIGHAALMAVAGAALLVAVLMTGLITLIGLRSVAIEIWVRRLGIGDFEYRIEPWGRDEISQTCIALETLRQNSIRALQLDTVQMLSGELREKNEELERTLADLHQSQDRVISQQKLAELGELSSGVAHEMRNPLQFILNFASASIDIAAELRDILEQLEGPDRDEVEELIQNLTENMERVTHHGNRVNGIVSAMMIFDRGTGGGFREVDLNELLVEQTNLAHHAVMAYEPGFSAEVSMELAPGVEEVVAIPEDIARVIAHLATNSCEGMVEKAREEGSDYRPELKVSTTSGEDGVTILFRDNGAGMTEETMSRMFNPFFTTRETGRNTGLGLSLVWDIVRGHGGDIEAASEQGRGAEVKVYLPRHPERRQEGLEAESRQAGVEPEPASQGQPV